MDWIRNFLICAIVVVIALLFIRWNDRQAQEHPLSTSPASTQVVVPEVQDRELPSPTVDQPVQTPGASVQMEEKTSSVARLITVRSDTLELTIDTYGGDIVRASLLKYLQEQAPQSPAITILNRTGDQTYIAQSGLIGRNGTDTNQGRPQYRSQAEQFVLAEGEDSLTVELLYVKDEVKITKQFTLRRGDYLVDVEYLVDNGSQSSWQAGLFGQIQRDSHEPSAAVGMGMQPYLGAAITTPDENYKKVAFADLDDGPFQSDKTGGWVAMAQHYFLSAWVPDQGVENHFSLKKLGSQPLYILGFTSPQVEVPAGGQAALGAQFYVGPKDQYRLEEISPYLDLTVDYGWLWWVAKPIFYVLTKIHELIGNWGWSIILLTILIKALFFRLSATSYRSMAKMRKLQPEMARLKDLYGDDRQKLSQEMMNFYKKEKVNPMGGCLPILIQMPVFIALYWVLFESVELRHAPWILWIKDLSVKDPYYVLPVLNGICMFVTTLLQPEPPDPTQAKIMKIMPVAFSFMFAFFPAGLVLYWTINSLLSIAQQWAITRQIEAKS